MIENDPAPDPNDVREILRRNAERQRQCETMPPVDPRYKSPRYRRTRDALLAMLIVDTPLLFVAWRVGPGDPYAFVGTLAAVGLFTAWVSWKAWFLNTR
ncbi:MAG: hypothetical protein JNN01_09740 [Opitutaceae bacterium]|nr:hypothetical protein [Opitutaceae bacterium]